MSDDTTVSLVGEFAFDPTQFCKQEDALDRVCMALSEAGYPPDWRNEHLAQWFDGVPSELVFKSCGVMRVTHGHLCACERAEKTHSIWTATRLGLLGFHVGAYTDPALRVVYTSGIPLDA